MTAAARIIDFYNNNNADNFENIANELEVIMGEQPKRSAHTGGKGQERIAYPFKNAEDIQKMLNAFKNDGKMNFYLICVIGFNTGRRTRDIVENLTWDKLFNENGTFKTEMVIKEQKTKKWANCYINSVMKDAIKEYCDYYKIDPCKDSYTEKVFIQMEGGYKGRPLTYDGFRKAFLKKVEEIGYDYPLNTRSMRKTFGYFGKMLHPNDPNATSMIQAIFNHSSENITLNYIGLTHEKANQYYEDFGKFFGANVLENGDEKVELKKAKPVISLTNQNIATMLAEAVRMARSNPDMNELDIVNQMLGRADELAVC